MKRRCLWTAAILLVSGGTAFGSDLELLLPPALPAGSQEEVEVSPSPSDEVLAAPDAAVVPAMPLAPAMHGGYGLQGADCGCGAGLQCCERVPHHLDNVWDTYCAEKSHGHHGSLFSFLHIKKHRHGDCCAPACPAPGCSGCEHCQFGLPKLKLPHLGLKNCKRHCESCNECDSCNKCDTCQTNQPCQDCNACDRCPPRRSFLGRLRKPACCEPKCNTLPLDASVAYPAGAVDPAVAPPAPVAPPDVPMPELPSVEPAPEAQGWLPLPWMKRVPL